MKKLKQLLKRRRKNSGFTLVEMIVSCGLLGILVVGITVFITPVMRSAASNEKNVRATLLADTVNSYISRSTRNALMVQIFTNADRADAYEDGAIAKHENLKEMMEFIDNRKDSNGKNTCELRCISFTWQSDPQTLEEKYMVMNESFTGTASTAINTNPTPVFEYCFYDGLFPNFKVEQLMIPDDEETDEESSSDSSSSDSSSETSSDDPEKMKPVPAIKLTTEVSSVQSMTAPEFIGVGFTEYSNIKYMKSDNKFYEIISRDSENPNSTTFIYYVVRKSLETEVNPGE